MVYIYVRYYLLQWCLFFFVFSPSCRSPCRFSYWRLEVIYLTAFKYAYKYIIHITFVFLILSRPSALYLKTRSCGFRPSTNRLSSRSGLDTLVIWCRVPVPPFFLFLLDVILKLQSMLSPLSTCQWLFPISYILLISVSTYPVVNGVLNRLAVDTH